MTPISCLLIGEETLVIGCGDSNEIFEHGLFGFIVHNLVQDRGQIVRGRQIAPRRHHGEKVLFVEFREKLLANFRRG